MFISRLICILFIVIWTLLPQFVARPIAFVLITVGLIVCWLINAKMTVPQGSAPHTKISKGTYSILSIISMCVAGVVLLVILFAGTAHPNIVAFCCLFSAVLEIFILDLITTATAQQICVLKQPWLLMWICLIPSYLGLYIILSFFQIGLYPILWAVFLVAALGLCLYGTFTHRYSNSSTAASNLKNLTIPCLVISLLITFSLNFALDSSVGTPETYTATSIYRNRTDCVMENGRSFSCPRCPTPIGDEGIAHIYEGWLGISYVMPEY